MRVTTFLLEIEDLEFKELSKIGITLMPWHVNIANHMVTRRGPDRGAASRSPRCRQQPGTCGRRSELDQNVDRPPPTPARAESIILGIWGWSMQAPPVDIY